MTSVIASTGQNVGGDRFVNFQLHETFSSNDDFFGLDRKQKNNKGKDDAGTPPSNPRRILSLPGGGVQGVVTLESLALIEEKTGKPICDLFDMIVGTSTGGIIALALARNKHTGKPTLSARELQNLYIEHGESIFTASRLRRIFSVGGLFSHKFDVTGLRAQLEHHFNGLKLSDLDTPVSVNAVNLETNDLKIFRSHQGPRDDDFYLIDAALATSAVPGGFPIHTAINVAGEKTYMFSDGGLQKNNPVLVAYGEARKKYGTTPLTIVSVDTGDNRKKFQESLGRPLNGLLMQPFTLVARMLRGQGHSDEKIVQRLPDVHFIRINPKLDQDIDGFKPADTRLEAAKKSNLLNLTARAMMHLHKDMMNDASPIARLLALLNNTSPKNPATRSAELYQLPQAN